MTRLAATPRARLAFAWMLGAGLLMSMPVHAEEDGGIEKVLSKPTYRFCNDGKVRLTRAEHRFCSLLPAGQALCPALPEVCKQPIADNPLSSLFGSLDPDDADPSAQPTPGRGEDRATRGPRAAPSAAELTLSRLAQAVLIGLLALGIGLLVRAILRYRALGDDTNKAPAEPEAPDATAGVAAERQALETDVTRLLARAEAEASRGDYAAAVASTHAALLRRLDGEGLIAMHPSLTNGDYVRALAARPTLRASVQEVTRQVEHVQFGAAPATVGLFRAIYERVVPLANGSLLFGLLCLGLVGQASCRGDGALSGPTVTASGTAASGTAALVEFLRQRSLTVEHRTRSLSALEKESPKIVVLLRGVMLTEPLSKKLLAWVDRGGVLIVAGPAAVPEELGAEPQAASSAQTELTDPDGSLHVLAPPLRELHVTDSEATIVLSRGAKPYAIQRERGRGAIVVFADGQLFTNLALAFAANAEFVATLLMTWKLDIELCDHLTGAGAANPLEAVQHAELLPVLGQLLFLFVLLLLHKGIAFGTLSDPPERRRRAFVDHVTALGHVYARARVAEHAAANLGAWALGRLREYTRGSRSDLASLSAAIAARTGGDQAAVLRVLSTAQERRAGSLPQVERPAHYLQLMHELLSLLRTIKQSPSKVPARPR